MVYIDYGADSGPICGQSDIRSAWKSASENTIRNEYMNIFI